MAKNTRTRERKCRKNIATLLSLMGFKDDNPDATVKTMRAKLREIEERTKFKKPISPTRRLKIKCAGKTTTRFLKPTPPQSSKTTTLVVSNGNAVDHEEDDDDDVRMELNNNGDNMELADSSNINVFQENDPLPDRIEDLMNFIAGVGGSRFKLLIQKKLTSSDVTKSLGRLLIPTIYIEKSGILTEIEKRKIGNGGDVSVPVFDPKRREWTLNLKRWNMNTKVYALKTKWNAIVDTNGFEEGMVIQVWSFRVNQEQLCFALVRV